MKKIMIICLVALMAVAGTTAALASANFRDGEEGPEANSTHVEGLEAINEDGEANEEAHAEGNDEGIAEVSHFEDGEEGPEANPTHVEGSEAINEDGEANEASYEKDNDSIKGNSADEANEASHTGDND